MVVIHINILIENNFFGSLLLRNDRKQILKNKCKFSGPACSFNCIFPTLPLPGRQRLLLAGAGRTQQIRLEETYTPMMMKPARKVICDSQFLTFFTY